VLGVVEHVGLGDLLRVRLPPGDVLLRSSTRDYTALAVLGGRAGGREGAFAFLHREGARLLGIVRTFYEAIEGDAKFSKTQGYVTYLKELLAEFNLDIDVHAGLHRKPHRAHTASRRRAHTPMLAPIRHVNSNHIPAAGQHWRAAKIPLTG
jgi:hypothetical protein